MHIAGRQRTAVRAVAEQVHSLPQRCGLLGERVPAAASRLCRSDLRAEGCFGCGPEADAEPIQESS